MVRNEASIKVKIKGKAFGKSKSSNCIAFPDHSNKQLL